MQLIKLTRIAYDKQMLYNSSIEDVELYLDMVEDNIRDLFKKMNLNKIPDYIDDGKIDKNN